MGETDNLIADTDDAADEDMLASDSVMRKVVSIVAEVLHVPKNQVGIDTTAADVEGWDSFGHVRIVLAIDAAFRIKLSMEAIEKAGSVGGLVDAVEDALAVC